MLRRIFVAIGVSVMVLGGVLPAQADDNGNKKAHQQILNAVTGGSTGGSTEHATQNSAHATQDTAHASQSTSHGTLQSEHATQNTSHSTLQSEHAAQNTAHDALSQQLTEVKATQETILQKLMDLGAGPPVTGGGFPCSQGGTPVGERWVVATSGLTVCDKNFNLTWEQHPLSTLRTWDEGHAYCASLGQGWRMPERDELLTLVDTSNSSPALPTGHPIANVQSASYWSATTLAGSPAIAWVVFFTNGVADGNGKTFTDHAWCVRGGA